MLIYRFKVTLQDHEEFSLEIEIQPGQSFRDFHECITEASELLPPEKAFFYPTDRKNQRSTEIALKSYKREERKFDPELDEMVTVVTTPRLMKDCKVKNYIEDPHQRLVYEYFGKVPHTFQIELFKIVQSDGLTIYPKCVKKTGTIPVRVAPVPIPDEPPAETPKKDQPKIVLPPLEGLAKLDDIVEDEDELAKIEEGLNEFLSEEAPEEPETEEKANGSDDEENVNPYGEQEEDDQEDKISHLEDYDDIENIEMNYSRYDSDPDDH